MLPWVVGFIWTMLVFSVYFFVFPEFSAFWPILLAYGVGFPMFMYLEKIEKRTD